MSKLKNKFNSFDVHYNCSVCVSQDICLESSYDISFETVKPITLFSALKLFHKLYLKNNPIGCTVKSIEGFYV